MCFNHCYCCFQSHVSSPVLQQRRWPLQITSHTQGIKMRTNNLEYYYSVNELGSQSLRCVNFRKPLGVVDDQYVTLFKCTHYWLCSLWIAEGRSDRWRWPRQRKGCWRRCQTNRSPPTTHYILQSQRPDRRKVCVCVRVFVFIIKDHCILLLFLLKPSPGPSPFFYYYYYF